MRMLNDLTGQSFNKWTVIKSVSKYNGSYVCRCQCGTESEIKAYVLRSGKVKGCRKCRSYPNPSKYNDLTNKTFGKWMVIKHEGTKNKKRMWLCKCSCGKESIVEARNLLSGRSKAVNGALNTPQNSKMLLKKDGIIFPKKNP